MNAIRELLQEIAPDAMLADGLDDALVGYDTKGRAIYSVNKIIRIFTERDGMPQEEAREYFEFNIEQANVGEKTPIYLCDA